MGLLWQVFFGSLGLLVSAGVHIVLIALCVPWFGVASRWVERTGPRAKPTLLLGMGFGIITLAHTVQIWGWAMAFLSIGGFMTFADAFYFAIVTYTTLGYGDMVLSDGHRIFGAFAAITGLLTFGVSTAFLIEVTVRIWPKSTDPEE